MSRRADENGSSYLRTYQSFQQKPTREAFTTACESQGVPAPSTRMFAHIRKLFLAREARYIPMNQLDVRLSTAAKTWTRNRILELVERGERERGDLDFKQSVGGDATTKKVWAAMANSGGGAVVYGIEEKSTAASALKPIKLYGVEERFRQQNLSVDPPTSIEVDVIPSQTDGSDLGFVVARIGAAATGLIHLVDGRAPVRDGATTRLMKSEEIRRWVSEGPRPTT